MQQTLYVVKDKIQYLRYAGGDLPTFYIGIGEDEVRIEYKGRNEEAINSLISELDTVELDF